MIFVIIYININYLINPIRTNTRFFLLINGEKNSIKKIYSFSEK